MEKNVENYAFDWKKTPQMSMVQLLMAVFIPSAIAFIGFHVVLPILVANGLPAMIAWPSVASVMLLGLVIVAVFLLHKEAKTMGVSLWTRMCMKKLSFKEWGFYSGIIILSLVASLIARGLISPFMNALHLSIPNYMPFFLNPAINPATTDMSILSPGLPLPGSYGLLPLIGIALLLNILTEELYFRAWMLPKLTRYGAWGWVMNGIFFALYHTFQIWLLPILLIMSLSFAFIFYRSKSIWPLFAAHLIANFLFSILGILMLIVG
jgi:membrane protease YdiL (CAAX protease family)